MPTDTTRARRGPGQLPLAGGRRARALRPRRPRRRAAPARAARARPEGGEWSDWIETANGDPVYFGGADELQLRTRGWRPAGTLHYVNVSGTTSALGGLLTGAREAINSAFISAARPARCRGRGGAGAPARSSPGAPGARTEPRAAASREPRRSCGTVKAAAVHHTVTANNYTPRRGAGDRARDLPLSPQRQRLERHRLQRARRPLRQHLRGPRGRAAPGRWSAPTRRATTPRPPASPSIGTHTETPITPATSDGARRLPRLEARRPRAAARPARRRWSRPAARRAATREGRRVADRAGSSATARSGSPPARARRSSAEIRGIRRAVQAGSTSRRAGRAADRRPSPTAPPDDGGAVPK